MALKSPPLVLEQWVGYYFCSITPQRGNYSGLNKCFANCLLLRHVLELLFLSSRPRLTPEIIAGLSGFYGVTESDEDRFKILDKAYEMGETFWDSADVYLDNEDLIGKWFKRTGKRDEIFVATKFAISWKDGQPSRRSDPVYVKEACEKSLKRLGVPTIDLYYCHRLDGVTPIEKTVQAMAELKK